MKAILDLIPFITSNITNEIKKINQNNKPTKENVKALKVNLYHSWYKIASIDQRYMIVWTNNYYISSYIGTSQTLSCCVAFDDEPIPPQ